MAADAANDATDGSAQDADGPLECGSAGSPDPSFATGGLIASMFGQHPGEQWGAAAVAVDSSGRILVAGNGPWRGGAALTVVRLRPDGSLDATFGNGGIAQVGIDGDQAWAEGIAIQQDGRIVAAGGVNSSDSARLFITRFDTDGLLDTTFGDNGVVVDQPAPLGHAVRVRVDATQRIVVAAETWDSADASSPAYFTTLRYTVEGARDPAFHGSGVAAPAFSAGQHVAFDLALQPDGKIDVVGSYVPFSGSAGIGIAQYADDGTLDSSFGDGGLDVLSFGSGGGATGTIPTSSHGLLITGFDEAQHAIVIRVESMGVLDSSFGSGGSSAAMSGVARRPAAASATDFVVAGTTQDFDIRVTRYLMDGTTDASFGGNGNAVMSTGTRAVTNDVALQSDGRIVVVGGHGDGITSDYFVARLCP